MILEDATFEAYGYYPRDLKSHSHKSVLAACDDCGKVRRIPKDGYRALCLSCGHREENSPNRKGKMKCICLQCGKMFKLFPSDIEAGGGKYCCLKCKNNAQKNQVKSICLQCCKAFKTISSRIKNGYGKYCNVKCKNEAQEVKRIECVCQWCGKKIFIVESDKKYNRGRYCSKNALVLPIQKGVRKLLRLEPTLSAGDLDIYCFCL